MLLNLEAGTGKPLSIHRSRSTQFLVYSVSIASFLIYSLSSLLRHDQLRTSGYDLGIFDQAVGSYARFQAPISQLKGPDFNLLGDHFHPILATLVPLYWLWSDARMLLLAQAGLIAVSVLSVGAYANRTLGRGPGIAMSIAYALSFGLQGLVAFDFHEVAFAVPLLSLTLVALAEERWRAAGLWALPLLLVKEDMGLTVAAIGCYLAWKRQWALGSGVTLAGLVAVPLTTLVLIPALNWRGIYPYFSGHGFSLSDPLGKLTLLLMLITVTGFAAIRSPLLLIAVPSLASRLASSNPLYWSTGTVHYNAILMPIVFVAAIAALQGTATSAYRRFVPGLALAVAVVLLPFSPLGRISVREDPHAHAALRVMRMIPDGSKVAAGNNLVPHLTSRTTVYPFPDFSSRRYDWVVIDLKRRSNVPRTVPQQDAALAALPAQGFTQVVTSDGIVLYRRR